MTVPPALPFAVEAGRAYRIETRLRCRASQAGTETETFLDLTAVRRDNTPFGDPFVVQVAGLAATAAGAPYVG